LILNNLDPNTKYQWQVRSKCWKEQFSAWSAVNTFTTSGSFAANDPTQPDDIQQKDVWLSPNPATDHLLVHIPKYTGKINLHVYDYAGNLMISSTGENTQQYRIDVSKLKTGMYVLRVVYGNGNDISLTWLKE